ncbi:MAG: S8 family serine peptidase [Nitrososphaerota archaeon]
MVRGNIDDALNITKFLDVLSSETGDGCRIVFIDTGVANDLEVQDIINLTDESIVDVTQHGSIIQYIISYILPEAEIYAVKIPDPVPDHILISALNEAMKWRPHAINLSFTSEFPSDGTDPCSIYVDYVSRSSVVCISAGNGGPRFMSIGAPATAREALTVGATDTRGRLWIKSSRGPTLDGRWKPNIVAPTNYVIPEIDEDESWPGTSFSAPIATALSAILMREIGDSYVVRRIIEITATSIPIIFSGKIMLKGIRQSSLIKRIFEAWPRLLDSRNLIGMGLLNAAEAVKTAKHLRLIASKIS